MLYEDFNLHKYLEIKKITLKICMIDRKSKLTLVKLWRYAFYFVLYPLQYKTDSS